MKSALRIASVLSWINLIIWGFTSLILLLSALVLGPLPLVMAILLGSIPLNSYAALRLHRSIRRPAIKLSHQTPAGIRFVGFVALFFGIFTVSDSLTALIHPAETLESIRQFYAKSNVKNVPVLSLSLVRGLSTAMLLLGLAVVINVQLNFRLLRWYYLVQKSDAP